MRTCLLGLLVRPVLLVAQSPAVRPAAPGRDGISQKVLTNTLRGLERDGIVTRRIYASVPPKVEYSLTHLGRSLCGLVEAICGWAEANIEQVQDAREVYDRAAGSIAQSQLSGS
jgi:DNA-binding PadR family transcriptional regulator